MEKNEKKPDQKPKTEAKAGAKPRRKNRRSAMGELVDKMQTAAATKLNDAAKTYAATHGVTLENDAKDALLAIGATPNETSVRSFLIAAIGPLAGASKVKVEGAIREILTPENVLSMN